MWLATTGDSADLAVCHLIRCSNSAGLFFSSFCPEPVPAAAVFCNRAAFFFCVLICYFELNETLLGFVFVVFERFLETLA